MAARKAITKAQAVRYRAGSRAVKSEILDAVCSVTGFNRDYARRALKRALGPRVIRPRAPRAPKYDATVVAALQKCWAVANAPAGKRLAPLLAELVPVLRRYGELDIDEDVATLLMSMSAATIDRRLRTALATLAPVGGDTGPSPYDLVLAGLGACTSMAVRMYAERKGWPLDRVTVRLHHLRIHAEDCADCETKAGMLDQIQRTIRFDGDLDEQQRQRLLQIADKCPVRRTPQSEVRIVTTESATDFGPV